MNQPQWFPAPSVEAGLTQANQAWPKRSRVADGTIGDAAHAARESDHNPDENGEIHAFDLTHDPAHGVDTVLLAEIIRLNRDPRVKYVIAHGRIFLGPHSDGVKSHSELPWVWMPYSGADPHTDHMHVSIGYTDWAETNLNRWYALHHNMFPMFPGYLHEGMVDNQYVRLVQRRLHYHFGWHELGIDGDYGKDTKHAVATFQANHRIGQSGAVDVDTWSKLFAIG